MIISLLLSTQIAVIAHRGEHLKHAENSIGAIQSAIALGADYAELDVRTTRDGKLILMHDKTVDSTTVGHGEVKNLTEDQILHLHFRSYPGTVPSFDEALEAARGKIGVYVDWKDASPEAIYRVLAARGMLDKVVVYGDLGELRRLQDLAPHVRVMPEADDSVALAQSERMLKPTVIAFEQDDFKPELIKQALEMRAVIYVDRLDEQDTPQDWQDAIDRGARGIQTDHPAELVKFLRQKHLHQ